MKVLSLFDGISCGMVALERAEIPVERYVAYEIDKYAIQISKKNYPQIEQMGDVTTADFTQYKGFDLLIGGSPCTYWSIAKKGRETTPDGIGGQLFMHYVRALKESGCKYFLYENNYSIHKNIKAFISEQLGVEPIMINSALVSAQQRKRFYWTNIPNVKQPDDKGILLKDIIEPLAITDKEKSHCLLSSCGRTTEREYFIKNQGQMVAEPVGVAQRGRYINTNSRSKKVDGGTYQSIEARKDKKANCVTTVHKDCMIAEPILINTSKEGKSQTIKATSSKVSLANICRKGSFGATGVAKPIRIGQYGNGSQAQRIYSVKGKSVCLQGQAGGQGAKTGMYKVDLPDGDYIIRKLSSLEAERLQTLPDNYTEGISNTQRYKCIGNGWTIDVIAHILQGLKR